MPIAKNAFLWTTGVLLIAGLVALIGIVGMSWWLVERSDAYFEEVIEAREARAAAVSVRNALQDMETSQRGFILTGEDDYLEPYRRGVERITPVYERLREILAPFPQAEQPMADLGQTITEKTEEINETIALYREGSVEEALALIRTDRGRVLMEDARSLLDAIIRAADVRLDEGAADQRANTVALRWVTIIGGIIIVLVAGAAVWIALRYTREIVEARTELEVLNSALEERVDERTEELIRANEEIQRFAYIVTHDLRAPLVNIMGFTSELDQTMETVQKYVLADGGTLSEQEIRDARLAAEEDLPEAIGFIRSSTKKMDGLINAILKISRDGRRPIKPEQIELRDVLELSADSVQHQVVETDGRIAVDADMPAIMGDRLSLEQIFGNLIDNAVKYRADRPIEIDITAQRIPGGRVKVDVRDNGRGIAPQDHQRVFDLFRRSGTQDKPGEGIGLAHVRTLVRNMGGDITLKSELGEGTTFSVILPTDIRTVARSMSVE